MASEVIRGLEFLIGTPWGFELDADLKPVPMSFIAAYGHSIRAFMTYREDIA